MLGFSAAFAGGSRHDGGVPLCAGDRGQRHRAVPQRVQRARRAGGAADTAGALPAGAGKAGGRVWRGSGGDKPGGMRRQFTPPPPLPPLYKKMHTYCICVLARLPQPLGAWQEQYMMFGTAQPPSILPVPCIPITCFVHHISSPWDTSQAAAASAAGRGCQPRWRRYVCWALREAHWRQHHGTRHHHTAVDQEGARREPHCEDHGVALAA